MIFFFALLQDPAGVSRFKKAASAHCSKAARDSGSATLVKYQGLDPIGTLPWSNFNFTFLKVKFSDFYNTWAIRAASTAPRTGPSSHFQTRGERFQKSKLGINDFKNLN